LRACCAWRIALFCKRRAQQHSPLLPSPSGCLFADDRCRVGGMIATLGGRVLTRAFLSIPRCLPAAFLYCAVCAARLARRAWYATSLQTACCLFWAAFYTLLPSWFNQGVRFGLNATARRRLPSCLRYRGATGAPDSWFTFARFAVRGPVSNLHVRATLHRCLPRARLRVSSFLHSRNQTLHFTAFLRGAAHAQGRFGRGHTRRAPATNGRIADKDASAPGVSSSSPTSIGTLVRGTLPLPGFLDDLRFAVHNGFFFDWRGAGATRAWLQRGR